MGLRKFVDSIMGNKIKNVKTKNNSRSGAFGSEAAVEDFYKEFALQSCISIIANAFTLCEIQTYENYKKVKSDNYYLFNVEPNMNQNSKEFWHEVISKLIYNNEALIIQEAGQFFIADEFEVVENALSDYEYKGVKIKEHVFTQSFFEQDVIYLKLNNENITELIDGLYGSYGKLLMSGVKNYKRSNGLKGFVEIDTTVAQTDDSKVKLKELMEKQFKTWFEKDDAILPLSKGFKFTDATSKNTQNTRDIRAIVNDIIDFVCVATHVPSGLVKGDTVGVAEQTDNFIMFGINPFAEIVKDEFNRKYYKKQGFLKGNYINIDTLRIKNVDLSKMASAGDLLFRTGVNSINDNLEMLGRETIKEAWANEHYITKNYQSVLSIGQENGTNTGSKGGDENGKENGQSKV